MDLIKEQNKKPRDTIKTLKKIFSYMFEFKISLAIVLLAIIFTSFSRIIGTAFLSIIIDKYLTPLANNYTTELFVGFVKTIFLLALIYVFGVIFAYIYTRIMVSVSAKVLYKIRLDLFKKMEYLPLKYFDTHTHGELMSLYTNDIDVIRELISESFATCIFSIISLSGVFIMMLYYSWHLTLLVVLMLIVMVIFAKKVGSKSSDYFGKQQYELSKINGYIEEMVEGQKVVKVFCHEDKSKFNFSQLNSRLCEVATKANIYVNVIMPVLVNLSDISYTIITIIGCGLVLKGILSLGTIIAFTHYTRQFVRPLTEMSQELTGILRALAGAERVFNVIEKEPEINNGKIRIVKNEDGILKWKDGDKYRDFKGEIEFDNVIFGYNSKKTILKGISLRAEDDKKVAFVGSTGAGKTTITNLINRFYDVDQGKITFDGYDIREIDKDDLRGVISIVLQDTHLFTETVMNNIRYGRLDATDEEVIEAAKLANADTFIQYLPDGYNTVLTGDASNLSQGERQLLAIARAIVAKSQVLILDEATSSIDTRTEFLIEKGMQELMKGKTVFIIAHRLSTIRNADVIIVLEHGEIIEQGSHKELLKLKGRYYQLYNGMFELD